MGSYERDQVEDSLRRAMGGAESVTRYLEGDHVARAYEHGGAADALHELDQARERLDSAASALGFDPADLRRARL